MDRRVDSSTQARSDEQPPPYTAPAAAAYSSFVGTSPLFAHLPPIGPFTPHAYQPAMIPVMPQPMTMMTMMTPGAAHQPWLPPGVGTFYLPNTVVQPSGVAFGPADQYTVTEPAVPFDPSSDPPFDDRTQLYRPRAHGVLKITNIPYNISISEAHQFICKFIPSTDLIKAHIDGYPIHVIMERSTGKTMDCFVEIISPETAKEAWEHAFGTKCMRLPKIGQRVVTVELSDQRELMEALFPRAISVTFLKEQFGVPKRLANRDLFSSGFKSFVTNEELTCMVRHAEYPQRSQFAARSLQRTFESMISTLYKFPWYSTHLYTIEQRDTIFKSYIRQLDVLITKVDSTQQQPREVGLDHKLLMDFLFAGMNCSGFSERQRFQIVQASNMVGPGMNISTHARSWPFQTLSSDPATLTDQDITMWMDVLNMGMVVIEDEVRECIGIHPHLQVSRDSKGSIMFEPTDKGCKLQRAEFSTLEKEFMLELFHKGWAVYMHQMGIEPSPNFDEEYALKLRQVREAEILGRPTPVPFDEFGGVPPDPGQHLHYNEATGLYSTVPTDGQDAHSDTHDEQEFPQYDDYRAAAEARDAAANKSLASFLELLRKTREEASQEQDTMLPTAKIPSYDAAVDGLGTGLRNLNMGAGNRKAFQQRMSPLLNAESPVFEPRGPISQHCGDGIFETSALSAYHQPTLGNYHATSPPRISTARKPPVRTMPAAARSPETASTGLGIDFGTQFQIPARERRSLPIRAPDESPMNYIRAAAQEYGDALSLLSKDLKAAKASIMGTPTRSLATPMTVGTPITLSPVTPRRNPEASYNSPVAMPAVGRPSPGHIRNYGLSSSLTFGRVAGVSSTHSSPVLPTTLTSGVAPPPYNSNNNITSFGSPYPFSDGGRRRARARSTFGITEIIDEEDFDADDEQTYVYRPSTETTGRVSRNSILRYRPLGA